MASVRLTRLAITDYEDIIDFLESKAGARVADRYRQLFDAALDRIAVNPGVGAPRIKLGPKTRILVVYPYSIYYDGEPKGEVATALRILHGRRRVTGRIIRAGRQQ